MEKNVLFILNNFNFLNMTFIFKFTICFLILMITYIVYKEFINNKELPNSRHNHLSFWQEIKLGYNQYKAITLMPQFIIDFDNLWYIKVFNVMGFICFFIIIITYKDYSNLSIPTLPIIISNLDIIISNLWITISNLWISIPKFYKIFMFLFIKVISHIYFVYKITWNLIKLFFLLKQILRYGLIVRNNRICYIATFTNTAANGNLIIKFMGIVIASGAGWSILINATAGDFGIPKPHIARRIIGPIVDRILSEDALFMKTTNIINSEKEDISKAFKKYLNASNDVSDKYSSEWALNYFIKVKAQSVSEINSSYQTYFKRFPNSLNMSAEKFLSCNQGENLVTRVQKEALFNELNKFNVNNPADAIKIQNYYKEKSEEFILINKNLEISHENLLIVKNKLSNMNYYISRLEYNNLQTELEILENNYNKYVELSKIKHLQMEAGFYKLTELNNIQ